MTINHAPHASQAIVNSAIAAGITAEVIAKSRSSYRRHHANGSTAVPQKVVLLNGIRMSLGQARQYIEARQHVEFPLPSNSEITEINYYYGWENSQGGYLYSNNLAAAQKYRENYNYEFGGSSYKGKLPEPQKIPTDKLKTSNPMFLEFNQFIN